MVSVWISEFLVDGDDVEPRRICRGADEDNGVGHEI
jgi:hypothetical protein